MGMIVNKQFKEPDLKELFEKLYIGDDAINSLVNDIFFGGPVLLERGIVLHDSSYESEGTVNLSDRFSMTSQQHVLKELQTKPDIPFKLMLGHSGWGAGQLEREIENGDWLMQNTTPDFIFNVKGARKYQSGPVLSTFFFFFCPCALAAAFYIFDFRKTKLPNAQKHVFCAMKKATNVFGDTIN